MERYVVRYEPSYKSSILYRLIVQIGNLLFWIAFIGFSYQVFLICQHDRHTWIVEDILNGIFGGVFFIYPLSFIKNGLGRTFDNWIALIIIMVILNGFGLLISSLLGYQ
jgi:hypothetical protein